MESLLTAQWWPAATIMSFASAGYMLVNQQFKLKATTLMIWRGFGVCAVLLPFLFFVALPVSPAFYVAVITNGLIVGVMDSMVIHSTKTFGAGPTSRLLPLSVWLSFLIWYVISPKYQALVLADPWRMTGVVGALVLAVMAMMFFRKDEVGKSCLKFLLPVILIGGVVDALNKTAVDIAGADGTLTGGILAYAALLSFTSGCVVLAIRFLSTRRMDLHEAIEPQAIKAGLITIACIISAMSFKNFGNYLASNPAYVSTLGLAVPLWVLLFNKFYGVQDRSNIFAGMLFVISVVMLVLFTSSY